MNQSINTDSKNSKEPQQKYRLGTVSIKILGGLDLDASYVTYPRLIPLKNDTYISNFPVYLKEIPPLLLDVETLFLNHIHVTEFDGIKLYIDNCSLTIGWGFTRVLDWTNVYLSGYNTPLLDVEIKLPPNKIKYINLSKNNIDVIGANWGIFRHFPTLTATDLWKNKFRKKQDILTTRFQYYFKIISS